VLHACYPNQSERRVAESLASCFAAEREQNVEHCTVVSTVVVIGAPTLFIATILRDQPRGQDVCAARRCQHVWVKRDA
jgi:hypothetical protein